MAKIYFLAIFIVFFNTSCFFYSGTSEIAKKPAVEWKAEKVLDLINFSWVEEKKNPLEALEHIVTPFVFPSTHENFKKIVASPPGVLPGSRLGFRWKHTLFLDGHFVTLSQASLSFVDKAVQWQVHRDDTFVFYWLPDDVKLNGEQKIHLKMVYGDQISWEKEGTFFLSYRFEWPYLLFFIGYQMM